jgi:predicted DNA-binding mobile mystery protein A
MSDQEYTNPLARKHLDPRLDAIRAGQLFARPPKGWLRAIRDALGMTTRQMAMRAGVSQPSVTAWEQAEVNDAMTLRKLREAAEALDCELVYALVPRASLEQMVQDRASFLADQHLARTRHSMRLEAQDLEQDAFKHEKARVTDDLLRSKPSRLWENE